MCGITGFLTQSFSNNKEMEAIVSSMSFSLEHRGPDDSGVWVDGEAGIAFGHRRLSIIDLSIAGSQPMHTSSECYVIGFNGEIYNHIQIRNKLQQETSKTFKWRGHSDTETLLAAFEHWGISKTLKACEGMFSIALWDKNERMLTLARDRFGEKPLYYGWTNGVFVFGSELKALRAYPAFNNPICRHALVDYLRYNYVPTPKTIYKNIYKLEPGTFIQLKDKHLKSRDVNPQRYWSLDELVQYGQKNMFVNENKAVSELETCLQESVSSQMLADVPLGAFLSGGVDSSTIVALMQKQSSKPVKTFTVGFEDSNFDETLYARAVAKHLGTEHSELYITASDTRALIPRLPNIYDEPFADSSQIPTYLICQSARQQVKVALSGDGGDELFGGYNRYTWTPRIWSRLSWLPYPIRKSLGLSITTLPVQTLNIIGNIIKSFISNKESIVLLGNKLHKIGHGLKRVRSLDEFLIYLSTEWENPEALIKNLEGFSSGTKKFLQVEEIEKNLGLNEATTRMMYRDSLTYLPDDILCKVDRAAMATSLETRVPFLNHRVAGLAWRLPLSMKIKGNEGKWIIRQILHRYVPRKLIERPKTGFSIPIGQWLRGPLRDWAENLLDETRLEGEGFFHSQPIRKAWEQHLKGRYEWTSKLWSLIMFQAWLEEQK